MIKITKRSKGRSTAPNGYDLRLYINKAGKDANGNQRMSYVISTFDNAHVRITTTEFVGIGIADDYSRMYFETETKANGFKLSYNQTSPETTRFLKFGTECAPELAKFVGYYNLEFDEKEKLYFIRLREQAKAGAE